jgi:hypothetical protein
MVFSVQFILSTRPECMSTTRKRLGKARIALYRPDIMGYESRAPTGSLSKTGTFYRKSPTHLAPVWATSTDTPARKVHGDRFAKQPGIAGNRKSSVRSSFHKTHPPSGTALEATFRSSRTASFICPNNFARQNNVMDNIDFFHLFSRSGHWNPKLAES